VGKYFGVRFSLIVLMAFISCAWMEKKPGQGTPGANPVRNAVVLGACGCKKVLSYWGSEGP